MAGNTQFQAALDTLKENRSSSPEQDTETPETEEVVTEEVETEVVESDEIEEVSQDEVIETEETPTVEAPSSWSKEDAEHFSTLPPEARERILNRERDRDAKLRQNQDQIADDRKAIDVEKEALNADRESVKEQRAEYLEHLKAKAKKPDDDMLDPESDNYDPDAYHLKMRQFEKSIEEADKIETQINQEDAQALQTWQKQEVKTYREVLPQFVDDTEKGSKYRQDMANYAVNSLGLTIKEVGELFPTIPAKQMLIMDKARRWDEAHAKNSKAKTKPKQKALAGGANNPQKVKVPNMKDAAAGFEKDRSPAAAARLIAAARKKRAS